AFDEARSLREINPESGSATLVATRDLAVLWFKTAKAREAAHRDPQPAFQRAISLMEPLLNDRGAPPGWLRDVAVFRYGYGEALSARGQRAGARQQWESALALIDRQLAVSPDDPRLLQDRAQLQQKLGRRS